MNGRKYAFILLLVCIIQDSYCMRSLPSSLITNVMNNKWFMPAIVVTSLVVSNALNFWFTNQRAINAENETDEVKKQLETQKKEFINTQKEWIDLLHRKGVDTKVIKQPDQPTDAIEFINVSQDQLSHLVGEIEKVGFVHNKERGCYVNAQALELEKLLEEKEREKEEAFAISQAAILMEKEATKLVQEELLKLNGDINSLTDGINKIKNLFKTISTCTFVIPDNHDSNVLISAFVSLEWPLTKNNDNNVPYTYFYNDPITRKRIVTIMLESQKPLPPGGVMSPPLQRHKG